MINKKISEINKELKKLVKEFNKTNTMFKAKINYRHIHKYENDLCITFFNKNTYNNACINFYVFLEDLELEKKLEIVKVLLNNHSLLSNFINNKYNTVENIEEYIWEIKQ